MCILTSIISSIRCFDGREEIDGLKPFIMDRMGDCVVLAGKNGSGKTRILKSISVSLEDAIGRAKNGRSFHLDYMDELTARIDEIQSKITTPELSTKFDIGLERPRLQKLIQERASFLRVQFSAGFGVDNVVVINISSNVDFPFVDPDVVSRKEKDSLLKEYKSYDSRLNKSENCLIRISDVCEKYLVSSSEFCELSTHERAKREKEFRDLISSVDRFVDAKLGFDKECRPTIDGLPLFQGADRLSVGQKKLLDSISRIDADININDKVILIFDEPELFVHPAAIISIFERWRSKFKNIQIFVATHCVPLIAFLGYEHVWWVDGGRISYSGKTVERVLEGLLGGAENVSKLHNMTLEPARLAAHSFAAECLHLPAVVAETRHDPQGAQARDAIAGRSSNPPGEYRVLDFGAGKCRLLTSIFEEEAGTGGGEISYFAYEPSDQNVETSKKVIELYYDDGKNRYFTNYSELAEDCGFSSFDIVVMCNVMHEISPNDWVREFSRVKKLLKDKGYLLVIEDSQLPHGELAHSEGFIISDSTALQYLFSLKNKPVQIEPKNERYKGRLYAYCISKSDLTATPKSITKALEWLRRISLEKLNEIRSGSSQKYSDGSRYSLYSQQYINSTLALEKFRG